MKCPRCNAPMERDEVDNGVGMQPVGPWGCEACHYVEERPCFVSVVIEYKPIEIPSFLYEPVVGQEYVCRGSAPDGWSGERVRVLGVSLEQRTAKVQDVGGLFSEPYTTVVAWDDLEPAR